MPIGSVSFMKCCLECMNKPLDIIGELLQKDDDPERVEAIFSYIKDKQAFTNYDRYIFDSDLDESVDNDAMANLIIANLTAADVLKGEDDEEEEEEAIDALMEAVKEHQETLREDMIDREKSELAIEEIREILDNMVKVRN